MIINKNSQLEKEVINIQQQIENLNIPDDIFISIVANKDGYQIYDLKGISYSVNPKYLFEWLEKYQSDNDFKIVAAGLEKDQEKLGEKLWLEKDIAPLFFDHKEDFTQLPLQISQLFDPDQVINIEKTTNNKIIPSQLTTFDAYATSYSVESIKTMLQMAKGFQGKTVNFYSATPRGGGVALMRHALIRLYKLLGVDANWYVLIEHNDAFLVTKTKFHNVLQGVSPSDVKLEEEDKQTYLTWTQANFELLVDSFKEADVIVIDDPQPAGIIPKIKKVNAKAKIIYRSHIQIRADLCNVDQSPQSITWSFLWQFIRLADLYVWQPIENFVPQEVEKEKLVFMPPTTDPLDGLNKKLNQKQINYYLKIINRHLLETNQKPINQDQPIITQIARFDPSKGIPDVIESFYLLTEKIDKNNTKPQLIIAGHGSVDDPDGIPVLTLINQMINEKYPHLKDQIKVARLPGNDQLLNTLLDISTIVMQLSHSEGYEIKVTEALMKGKPIISYNAGGIPLQIANEKNGFVIAKIGDTQNVANHLFRLLSDKKLYQQMSDQAISLYRRDVLTLPNALKWLFLSQKILTGDYRPDYKHINDLLKIDY